MNIVKFVDKIKTDDETFNQYFKAKYAHCLNWTYCVPFSDTLGSETGLTYEEACVYSRQLQAGTAVKTVLGNIPYLVWPSTEQDEYYDYVDQVKTKSANDILKYIAFNNFTPDSDITDEELNKFNVWLAQTILDFGIIKDDDTVHMLEYYAQGMTDDVIKYLEKFGSTQISLQYSQQPSCSCGGIGKGADNRTLIASIIEESQCRCSDNSMKLSGLYVPGLTHCNPIDIYRKNLYLKMVVMFSDIDFWTQFDSVFILEFKKYVDNILKSGRPLGTSKWKDDFVDCGCLSEQNQEQKRNQERLARLSAALDYIAQGEITGHKHNIRSALNEWAAVLYEKMYWPGWTHGV